MPQKQLNLPLSYDQCSSFDNYYQSNEFITDALKKSVEASADNFVFVSGGLATGKSHLLSALALYCQQNHVPLQYFSAEMLVDYSEDVITSAGPNSALIIDDIHLLAGLQEWERKLYDLYNVAQREGWTLVVSCAQEKREDFELKDWRSRMASGLQITLPQLLDSELKSIVQFRAQCLGLKINNDVIDFMFNHFDRSLVTQLEHLKVLDKASLESNRRITIPFLKSALSL